MVRPASNGPEWIEVYNPNDFAVALKGWSFNHSSGSTYTNLLLQGVLSGRPLLVYRRPDSQETRNATHVIDLGQSGFLGVGQLNGLADGQVCSPASPHPTR